MLLSRRAQAASVTAGDQICSLPQQEQSQPGQGSAGQDRTGWEWQQSIHCSFCPRPAAFPLPRAGCSQQGMSKQ